MGGWKLAIGLVPKKRMGPKKANQLGLLSLINGRFLYELKDSCWSGATLFCEIMSNNAVFKANTYEEIMVPLIGREGTPNNDTPTLS